jgi:hypothetical protein
MRRLFIKAIPSSANKLYITIPDGPFPEKAFALDNPINFRVPKLERLDDKPHVIYTGNPSTLWTQSLGNTRKDRLGPFFKKISQHNIHIFIGANGDTKKLPNIHLQPRRFENTDLFNSTYSRYISQFDAHLVFMNEYNSSIRRRVYGALGTRFAYALTATAPIVTTQTSKFIEEFWQSSPLGFTFNSVESLVTSLYDKESLESFRCNMKQNHKYYSFESNSIRINEFFYKIFKNR